MKRIEQAIILAAGEGQRLRPFTKFRPKVMLPIANKPILQYVVEALVNNGLRQITLVVGYHKEQVQNHFGSGKKFDAEIHYVVQEQQLGTAHALKQAKGKVKDKFLVLPGDNIIEPATLTPLLTATYPTILVKRQEDVSKYGAVVTEKGRVKSIVEKPKTKISHLINTGIYALTEEIFEVIKDEVDLPTALETMIARGYDIAVEEISAIWLDAVYPWDILKLNDFALSQTIPTVAGTVESGAVIKGRVSVGKETIIRSGSYIVGPVIIGEHCEIGPNICLFPATSIGDNVIISPFTEIRNCVIASNVTIGSNCSLQDSVIAQGSSLRGHFIACSGEAVIKVEEEYHQVTVGTMMGEYCQVGGNVTAYPGTIVGNNCSIRAMKVLSENIADGSLVI